MEIWKDVVGYEGYYQVSNLGRVKSLNYRGSKKEKILATNLERTGYVRTHLCKEGQHKTIRIHRLVAEAFLPNPDNKNCIDHINTNRADNRVENLRWVTHEENCNNDLTRKNGKRNGISKKVICVETSTIYNSIMEVERELGLLHSDICKCCKGTRVTVGGFHWKYAKSN